MSNRILVTPEKIDLVSQQFAQSGQQSSQIVQRLQQCIQQMEGQWEGITRERFYGEYQQARVTMNKFVECLHTVSTELKQISVKFKSTDESITGSAAGASISSSGFVAGAGAGVIAAGAGAAGAAGALDTAKVKDNKSLMDKMIDGVEVSGSVVEHEENGLYVKAISGEAGAGLTSGAHAEATIVEGGYSNDYVEGSVSVGKAEVEAAIKDGNLSVGAEATLNKYEGGVKIPLPFTDKELNIGGSASLGVVGGSAEIGKSGVKFHIPLGPGASLVGVGGSVTIE